MNLTLEKKSLSLALLALISMSLLSSGLIGYKLIDEKDQYLGVVIATILATIKAYVIITHFIEAKQAPRILRFALNAWLLITAGSIVFMFMRA